MFGICQNDQDQKAEKQGKTSRLGIGKEDSNSKKRKYQRKGTPKEDEQSSDAQRKLIGSEEAVVGKIRTVLLMMNVPTITTVFQRAITKKGMNDI